ncbi:MAG: alanine racemase [Candidatus Nanopelagicus sp.]
MSRAVAEINLNAIASNLKFIKGKTNAQLLAVVKADAYGHGLIPISKSVIEAGANWLGTALLEEAIALRESGIKVPIIAWLTPCGEDFKSAINLNIDLSISSLEVLNEIIDSSAQLGKKPRLHIEIDTGMSRGGVGDDWDSFVGEVSKLVKDDKISLVGVWSHFARADEPLEKMNSQQLSIFTDRVTKLINSGITPEFLHIANSAAALTFKDSHKNIIRWGIGLYGLSPDVNNIGDSISIGLKPAMKLKAKLNLVKKVKAGSTVGYGATAVVTQDTKLGVVTLGYADGIPRNANNLAGVFVCGKRAPLIGRVSMDQFVVDLGIESLAKTGDEVIVFGAGNDGEYTIDEWAKACGTINYEIVTRIGPRVPRIYTRE